MTSKRPKIGILLVDESSLVREGWKDILSPIGDFKIVGETTPISLPKTISQMETVNIVVANISLLAGTTKKNKILRLIKEKNSNIKILLIVRDEKDIRLARRVGADEALRKPYRSQALIDMIRGLDRDDKGLCDFYANELEELGIGSQEIEKYEKLMRDILQLLFSNHLLNLHSYSETQEEAQTITLICQNQRDNSFWDQLYSKHHSEHIIIMLQNSDKVDQNVIRSLADRLSDTTSLLGILIVRSNKTSLMETVQFSIFSNEQKIIILLTDKEIRHMLAQTAAGLDSAQLFEEIYEKLIGEMSQWMLKSRHSH
jgi:DNA-binding NarL/FixJ family response regulator